MHNMNSTKFAPWMSLAGAPHFVERELGDDKNEAANALRRVATELAKTSAKIEADVIAALGNEMGSELANTQAACQAIAKRAGPMLKRANDSVDYARCAVDALTAKTNPTAATDLMSAMQHQEARAALLHMSAAERRTAIATAIGSGDETFLGAVTSGSPALSGLTATEQASVREQWRSKRHPDDAARLARMKAAISQTQRLAVMFERWSSQIIPEAIMSGPKKVA
jgi:hypothetical protein